MSPHLSNALRRSICLGLALLCAARTAGAAGEGAVQATPPPGALTAPALCEIGGPQLKLDPKDLTNGFTHYKGTVWFRARYSLRGVNLRFKAGGKLCTCVTCPSGSSYATGLKPAGKIRKNETRSYAIDCPYPVTFFPIPFPVGHGEIDYFNQTQASGAGVFLSAKCTGSFALFPPDG